MNKRGISIVIGYVLLIAISIVISIFVYQWLKTYVPKESLECSDGTSAFISELSYDCVNSKLHITLKNNGRFSIAGYYIHVSENSDTDAVATIDLSQDVTESFEGEHKYGNSVVFVFGENALTPDEPYNFKKLSFDVSEYGLIYKVEIIPTRLQESEGKQRYVSCGSAKIEEILTCD